ncbi:hypothetical protein EKO04_000251 [Ascochyta lentis]|uniref:Uncharacterized protein n=1 Tax=Ascochyta lentis TaxID=205686 RepID=A0A8H7JCT1_9PLEO|nr:hypothetical protein EKO04_000251 [Ascochyta lentis]
MFNMNVFLTIALLVVLAIAIPQPCAHERAIDNANDEFWAKKPMHTTDLMASKSRSTLDTAIARTHIPTEAPTSQMPKVEVDEL